MKIRKIYWFLILIGLFAIGVWSIGFSEMRSERSTRAVSPDPLRIGDPVPAINLTALDGEEISLQDLGGRIVIINAFASWCGPCRLETPDLVKVYADYSDQIALVGLNVAEDRAAVQAYKDDFAVPYPLVLDPEGQISQAFRPPGLPTSWFIDGGGVVRYIHSGPMTVEFITGILADIWAGHLPAPFGS